MVFLPIVFCSVGSPFPLLCLPEVSIVHPFWCLRQCWEFPKALGSWKMQCRQPGKEVGACQRYWIWGQSKRSLTTYFHAFIGESTENMSRGSSIGSYTIFTLNIIWSNPLSTFIISLNLLQNWCQDYFPIWHTRRRSQCGLPSHRAHSCGVGLEAMCPDPQFACNFWQCWKLSDLKNSFKNRASRSLVWRRENTWNNHWFIQ